MLKRSAGILPYKYIDEDVYIYLEHPGGPFWKALFLCPFSCRTFSNGQKKSLCYAPDNYRKTQENEVQK